MARRTRRRPMSREMSGRLGGLTTVASHGPGHMAAVGRRGGEALDRRIAVMAGISDTLPPAEYQARLKAARTAYYLRLAEARWGSRGARR